MKKQIQKSEITGVNGLKGYHCFKCDWQWVPRKINPAACPHCKSYDWKGLIPNVETKKAIRESRKGKGLTRSKNVKELFENLNI